MSAAATAAALRDAVLAYDHAAIVRLLAPDVILRSPIVKLEVVISCRPLVGLLAVGAVMGPPLARRRGRLQWLAITLISRPLPRLFELMDPLLPRLIRRPPGSSA